MRDLYKLVSAAMLTWYLIATILSCAFLGHLWKDWRHPSVTLDASGSILITPDHNPHVLPDGTSVKVPLTDKTTTPAKPLIYNSL